MCVLPICKGGPSLKWSGGGHVGKGLMYPRMVPEAKSLPDMAAPGCWGRLMPVPDQKR